MKSELTVVGVLSLTRRTYHDVLELVEVCLDFDLQGNQLRVRFNGSPIVDVSAHETGRDVVLLVATANSVHRLAFTHPALLASHVRHTRCHIVLFQCLSHCLNSYVTRLPSDLLLFVLCICYC